MKPRLLLLSSALLLLINAACFSQNVIDTSKVTRIETKDGNIFTGSVIFQDSITVILKSGSIGEIKIPRSEIVSIIEYKNVTKTGDQYWFPNPQSTRYFWAPNGYGLNKGESYYQNIWILYNQVSAGITNNFSIGGGLVPLFLFGGTASPLWIIPKFSIPIVKDAFNIATGALVGTLVGGDNSGVFGLLFGTATFGSRDKNLSLGIAYGFAGGSMTKVPVFNLSGILRAGPKGYLITENYVITSEGETAVIISAGGRSIIKNIAIDYSLCIPIIPYMDTFVAIPFLGINIPLGKKK